MTEPNKDCDTVFYSKTLNYNCKVTEKESWKRKALFFMQKM